MILYNVFVVIVVVLLFFILPIVQMISDYRNSKKFDKAIDRLMALEYKINKLVERK